MDLSRSSPDLPRSPPTLPRLRLASNMVPFYRAGHGSFALARGPHLCGMRAEFPYSQGAAYDAVTVNEGMSRERVWSRVCLAVSLCHRLRTHGKVYCCPCAVRVNSGERSYHSSHRDIAITFSRERARSRCEFTEIYAGYAETTVRDRRGNSQKFTPNNGRSFG